MSSIRKGSVIEGRYEIDKILGKGGYGTVYLANQRSTGQRVAIKVLNPSMANNAEDAEAEIARFRREMALIAQLSHPNIVRLIDSGTTANGEMFTVLEYIEGRELSKLLREEGALPPKVARDLMFQVLDALSVAHQKGVVHRDLKPANIMVTTQGYRRNAMVLDFGISAITEDARGDDYETLTAAGRIHGTPAYMAPEQLRARAPAPATDIYAWGLIFLETLTGRKAVEGDTMVDILANQVSTTPVSIPQALLHMPLGHVLTRATAKPLSQRYANASEALSELEGVLFSPDQRFPWTGQVASVETMTSSPISQSLNPALNSGPAYVSGHLPAQKDTKKTVLLVLALAVLMLGGLAAGLVIKGNVSPEEKEATPEKPAAEEVEPPPPQELPPPPAEPQPGEIVQLANTRGGDMAFIPATDLSIGLATLDPILSLCNEALGEWAELVCVPEQFADFGASRSLSLPAFYMDIREVNVSQYQDCVDAGSCRKMDVKRCALLSNLGPFEVQELPEEHFEKVQEALSQESLPITCVNQLEARAYCHWAGKRLPREEEWERVASNGGETLFPWGDQSEAGGSLANGAEESLVKAMGWTESPKVAFRAGVENADGYAFAAPVGIFAAGLSPLNMLDLSGNAQEWTESLWVDKEGVEDPAFAVARGGGWADLGPWISAKARRKLAPSARRSDLGFRCVKDKLD